MRLFNFIKQYWTIALSNKLMLSLYGLYLVVVCMIPIAWCSTLAKMNHLNFTIADVFSMFGDPRVYPLSMVPFTALVVISLFRYDFRPSIIIRHRSKLTLWLKQVVITFLSSFIINIFVVVILLVASSFFTRQTINWNTFESLFNLLTLKILAENPSIVMVIVMCFLTSFFSVSIMTLLLMLTNWMNKLIYGYLLLLIICSFDLRYSGFFRINTIFFPRWLEYENMYIILIYPIIITLGLILFGMLAFKRKDFLDVK